MLRHNDLLVTSLGDCQHCPLCTSTHQVTRKPGKFCPDSDRIRFDLSLSASADDGEPLSLEEAGPRGQIFFDPARTTAAIVTCGGLSPGLNNVIRSVFYEFTENYQVLQVLGIRNGYLGLNPESGLAPIALTKEFVEPIDKLGGTVLGSSRGPQEPAVMADYLQSAGIDILLCVGGDGTLRGAYALDNELRRRGAKVAVIGIPKTIDNDVPFVRLSFGYATALEKAAEVIRGAHVEARCGPWNCPRETDGPTCWFYRRGSLGRQSGSRFYLGARVSFSARGRTWLPVHSARSRDTRPRPCRGRRRRGSRPASLC